MSQLLGLSFDAPASPEITFFASEALDGAAPTGAGWGVAWYPAGELAAVSVRDPFHTDGPVTSSLQDWDRFRTVTVLAHLGGAAKRRAHGDTEPFVRVLGGRTWTLAHDGDLGPDLASRLPLPPGPQFASIGPTGTEHLFSWLLAEATARDASSLRELGYDDLHRLLQRANQTGTLNVLLSDGTDLVAYQDVGGHGPLWCSRRTPPTSSEPLTGNGIRVVNSGWSDAYRTMVVVSSGPLGEAGWTQLDAGQLLVIRRGAVVASRVASGPRRPAGGAPPRPVGTVPKGTAPAPGPAGPGARRLLEVVHETTYAYDQPVERSSHSLRLSPVQDEQQRVQHHELLIGAAGSRYRFEDVFGNAVTGFEVTEPFDHLTITARSLVEVHELVDLPHLLPAPATLPLVWMPWQRQMMHAYLMPPELPESQLQELGVFAQSFVDRNRQDLLATLDDLNLTIYRDFTYVPGLTTLETTPFDVYAERAGVCQDFANLSICLARLLGIPARYRVGYIFTGTDYENTIQSEASHAWVEVYLPQLGWRGYDPTNGTQAGRDHIRVACGRNYRDATPTGGVIHRGGGGERLTTVVRVEERPLT